MRYRKRTLPLSYPRDAARVRDVVRAENLAAVRLEPSMRALRGVGYADAIFARGDDICVVPAIEIEPELVERRESSPFIWPAFAQETIEHERAAEIEDVLLPWIESLALGSRVFREELRTFDPQFAQVFEDARRFGFLGAAPYADVFATSAPYVYAIRFARDAAVAIADPACATGAAVLAAHARAVHADAGDASVLARRWFDLNIYDGCAQGADVTIGNCAPAPVHIGLGSADAAHRVCVATPVPMDITISFDPEDAPAARSFSVSVPARQPSAVLAEHTALGGSSGRIALVVRNDGLQFPDADTDAANDLAQRLDAEGFAATVCTAESCDPRSYDLLHVMCAIHPEQIVEKIALARASGKPVVVTAPLGTRDGEALWGPATIPFVLRLCRDEVSLEDHLRMLAARRLEVNTGREAEPHPGYVEQQRHVLELAKSLIPANAPPVLAQGKAASMAHAYGTGPYVLVHAPITPRANQLMVVRAAATAGLPLVVAGPIADFEYATHVRAFAGDGVAFVPEPLDGAERLALYAGARVFADAAWFAYGNARRELARAAGCAVVTAPAVDPASEAEWTQALEAAWAAPRPAPTAAADAFPDIIHAYATAQGASVPSA